MSDGSISAATRFWRMPDLRDMLVNCFPVRLRFDSTLARLALVDKDGLQSAYSRLFREVRYTHMVGHMSRGNLAKRVASDAVRVVVVDTPWVTKPIATKLPEQHPARQCIEHCPKFVHRSHEVAPSTFSADVVPLVVESVLKKCGNVHTIQIMEPRQATYVGPKIKIKVKTSGQRKHTDGSWTIRLHSSGPTAAIGSLPFRGCIDISWTHHIEFNSINEQSCCGWGPVGLAAARAMGYDIQLQTHLTVSTDRPLVAADFHDHMAHSESLYIRGGGRACQDFSAYLSQAASRGNFRNLDIDGLKSMSLKDIVTATWIDTTPLERLALMPSPSFNWNKLHFRDLPTLFEKLAARSRLLDHLTIKVEFDWVWGIMNDLLRVPRVEVKPSFRSIHLTLMGLRGVELGASLRWVEIWLAQYVAHNSSDLPPGWFDTYLAEVEGRNFMRTSWSDSVPQCSVFVNRLDAFVDVDR